MERGGFHGYRKVSPSINSGSKMLIPDSGMRLPELGHPNTNNGSSNSSSAGNNASGDDECTVREQDRFMPIANVIRIMRRILPPHAKISDDAKETIQECVSEYISFITGEANERCQHEQRKTITAEDVLWAMSKLGFDNYIEPLTLYLHRYRELEGERGSGGNVAMRGDHMMGMSGSLMMKRANGMVVDYGAHGAGLHMAVHYPHHHNNHMNHQNGFLFGGYNANANANFKDGSAIAGATSSAVAGAGGGGEVPTYEQHKY